eukprot:TRINITY_DN36217_c0_g1_i1.p1 TRINITY_DN36217_c0_g1~~TRINITY_DN36217_c0_g1_i1.p1  ORF type:complete len:156 (-),score=39.88 TRINITY_DN36217_c0_g1_i1:65-532(-)
MFPAFGGDVVSTESLEKHVDKAAAYDIKITAKTHIACAKPDAEKVSAANLQVVDFETAWKQALKAGATSVYGMLKVSGGAGGGKVTVSTVTPFRLVPKPSMIKDILAEKVKIVKKMKIVMIWKINDSKVFVPCGCCLVAAQKLACGGAGPVALAE